MALSNKFGPLLLTTGNKTETGGRLLHALRRHGRRPRGHQRRAQDDRLPAGARHQPRGRAPGHPARAAHQGAAPPNCGPNQTDQDSLPPYELLDRILEAYVERNEERRRPSPPQASIARPPCASSRLIDRNEYKRRQAAPGLKVTTKAFGVGRRYPVAADYRSVTQARDGSGRQK